MALRSLLPSHTRQPIDFEISDCESDSDLGSRLKNVGGAYFVCREKTEINRVETTLGIQASDEHRLELSYPYIRDRYDSDDNGSIDAALDGNNVPLSHLIANWNPAGHRNCHRLFKSAITLTAALMKQPVMMKSS